MIKLDFQTDCLTHYTLWLKDFKTSVYYSHRMSMLLLNIFMHSFIVFLKKTNARQCHIEHIYDIMSSFFFQIRYVLRHSLHFLRQNIQYILCSIKVHEHVLRCCYEEMFKQTKKSIFDLSIQSLAYISYLFKASLVWK